MLVNEIMTTEVPTVQANEVLRTVAGVICTKSIDGLPVVDDSGLLCGVVSAQQIMGKLLPSYAHFMDEDGERNQGFRNMVSSYTDLLGRTVGEVMVKVRTVYADDSAALAASIMSVHGSRCLPVVDRANHLLGVVSLEQIHKAMFIRGMGLAA